MKLFSSIIFSLFLISGIGFAAQAHAQVAAQCSTTGGYNTTTGMSCNGSTFVPVGCTSTAGFSANNGLPCNGSTVGVNGYNGAVVGTNNYLNGCTSVMGYSATTGYPCNMNVAGVAMNGVGMNPTTTTTTTSVNTMSPGLPTTGAGANTTANVALLIISGAAAFFSIRYGLRNNLGKNLDSAIK